MIFKKKYFKTYRNLEMGNTPIRWTDTDLGVTVISNLKWNLHIENRHEKALKGLNSMKALCGTLSGGDPTTLMTIQI